MTADSEAFLWSETRAVTMTATASMHTYEVDAALVGRKVELLFDPFDLAVIEVRWNNRPMGVAVPVTIGRHAHPAERPETPTPPSTSTGIDYLALVEARRDRGRSTDLQLGDTPRRPEQPGPAAHRPQPTETALHMGTHRPHRRHHRQRGRYPMSSEGVRSRRRSRPSRSCLSRSIDHDTAGLLAHRGRGDP